MTETTEQSPKGESIKLYNANDGLTGRQGGPYLDQEEARAAEERRARVEGRDPDFDNPGAYTGTVFVTASGLINASQINVPSVTGENKSKVDQKAVDAFVESDESSLTVAAEIPAEVSAEEPKEEAPPEVNAPEQPTPNEEDPFAGTPAE